MAVTRVLHMTAGAALCLALGAFTHHSASAQEQEKSGGVRSASEALWSSEAVQFAWDEGGLSFQAYPVGEGAGVAGGSSTRAWQIDVYDYAGQSHLLLTLRLSGLGNQPSRVAAKAITRAVALMQRSGNSHAEVRLTLSSSRVVVRARSVGERTHSAQTTEPAQTCGGDEICSDQFSGDEAVQVEWDQGLSFDVESAGCAMTIRASSGMPLASRCLVGGADPVTTWYYTLEKLVQLQGDVGYVSDAGGTFGSGRPSAGATDPTTATDLAAPATSLLGETIMLTATVPHVAPGSPTGDVTFFDGLTPLWTAPLDGTANATAFISGLLVGTHSLSAVYSGDAFYAPSTSAALTHVVQRAETATVVAASNPTPAVDELVTFIATVSVEIPGPSPATGQVEFFADASLLGTATLSGNPATAAFSVSSLSPGAHAITAVYAGSSNYSASVSPAIAVVIGPVPPN